jgi:hypothetical protein
MSRDDGLLYSGATSASFKSPAAQEVADKQKQAKEERKEKQLRLKPAAEPVLALIEKHKQLASHVQAVAKTSDITDQEAGEMLRSQRKIYEFLLQFEQEIKIALKEPSNE